MNIKGFAGGWALMMLGILGCGGGVAEPSPTLPRPPSITVQQGPNLNFPRDYHRAVTLADGRIAILGGADPNGTPVAPCEVVEADGSIVRPAGSLLFPRVDPVAVMLGTGKVALLGGDLDNHGTVATQVEVWDPVSGGSTHVGDLKTVHGGGAASAVLPDGKILLIGGGGYGDPELVDPATWTTEVLPSAMPMRGGAAIGHQPDGNIVIAGGSNGSVALRDRWVYDWKTKVFSRITGGDGDLAQARYLPGSAVLNDGRWILLGGGGDYGQAGLTSVEIYASPGGHRLTVTPGATGYILGTSTLLPADRVLLVGGASGSPLSSLGMPATRVYDPSQGTSTPGVPLSTGRWGHSATLLADGRILIAGGTTGRGALASTEILTVH